MTILVTGSAGFIGFHTTLSLLQNGHSVIGIDSLNSYYDPALKVRRNAILQEDPNYSFFECDITNYAALKEIISAHTPEVIIHLAAQAGVRYSLVNPWIYEQTNVLGTVNVFEAAKEFGIKKVVFASSSSVYGANTKIPFSESDVTDSPVSLYAATKKSTELIAHTYHHLYNITAIGLRFFTVYGEWYRPDMALFSFSKNILEGKPIQLFNNGKMERDFTFITDIVEGIIAAVYKDGLGFEVFNLGCDNPVELGTIVSLLEKGLNKKASINYAPMQPGDVVRTYANIYKAKEVLRYTPKVLIEEGIQKFCEWFIAEQEFLLSLNNAKQ
jgi:UDP-glucuronate 4-epimerase